MSILWLYIKYLYNISYKFRLKEISPTSHIVAGLQRRKYPPGPHRGDRTMRAMDGEQVAAVAMESWERLSMFTGFKPLKGNHITSPSKKSGQKFGGIDSGIMIHWLIRFFCWFWSICFGFSENSYFGEAPMASISIMLFSIRDTSLKSVWFGFFTILNEEPKTSVFQSRRIVG